MIIAAPKSESVPVHLRVPGSVTEKCGTCKEEVITSPSSQRFVKLGATILCLQCASEKMGRTSGPIAVISTSEQAEEIEAIEERKRRN